MYRRTLTLRLIAASAIWIVGTLCAAGLLLLLLFQDHIERRFDAAPADGGGGPRTAARRPVVIPVA